MDDDEWNRLLRAAREIQKWFPEGVTFIGGLAVYAQAADRAETAKFASMSHDADFMILLPDFADLRDIEVLTPNRRLGKQQFSKDGFEFDVYVEGQHDLPVPVAEAVAWSQSKRELCVACPEHLLVLKLKAYADRKGTGKGSKDEDDVITLLLVGEAWRKDCLTRLTEQMLGDLERIVLGDAPTRLAQGNLHEAKAIRARARSSLDAVCKAYAANYGSGDNDVISCP
ncbi:MAG: hypothetical protein ABSG76_06460 [Xanthobacteraceae bacterium]|jgi:hypothetical protein